MKERGSTYTRNMSARYQLLQSHPNLLTAFTICVPKSNLLLRVIEDLAGHFMCKGMEGRNCPSYSICKFWEQIMLGHNLMSMSPGMC